MTTIRPITYLLEILLQSLIWAEEDTTGEKAYTGMCLEVTRLWEAAKINEEEFIFLREYINTHPPKDLPALLVGYWFSPGIMAPRIKWVQKRIKEESKRKTEKE